MYRKTQQISVVEEMTNQWCVPDEMNDVLSVDYTFSGLEGDFCTSSNNINSSVFAVPEITRKEEICNSNINTSEKCQIDGFPVSVVHGKKVRYSQLTDIDCTNRVKRICFNKELEHSQSFQARCHPQNLSTPELHTNSHFYSSGSVINTILSQVVQLPTIDEGSQGPPSPFHCILSAPTSIFTKTNEETLTYLNQGQAYEMKIKKTGNLSAEKNALFKSVIRIGFQERRLQYIEKEQIKEWLSQRSGERILEIDVPLSYGILKALNNPLCINECEFVWDSNYDVGIFIKVNCISTEFTPKKHGGEKGVPFRIIIETYALNHQIERLHFASCQIKVFKPKGADRKHKTDREKMCKRLPTDKDKYHPQYEYTVFREIRVTDVLPYNNTKVSSYTSPRASPLSNGCSPQNSPLNCLTLQKDCCDLPQATSTTETLDIPVNLNEKINVIITHDSTSVECGLWLQKNKFVNYISDFENFTGKDLLNLTRSDLIDICGTANGIRLFNCLHGKGYLTTYVRLPTQKAYSAIYLKTSKVQEFILKIKTFCGLPLEYDCEFCVSGPGETRVIITDEVIYNILQDSLFVVECIEGSHEEKHCVFLKQTLF